MVPQHLRYSPVNYLIVPWSFGGRAFADCALPQRDCRTTPEPAPAEGCCRRLPIREAIDTYDWERWLPEVIVGIDDPDEEIAANYVRQAAIEFARAARVLQRTIVIELQPGVDTYPLFPFDDEQIIGVLAAQGETGCGCHCSGGCLGELCGLRFRFDAARNQVHVAGHRPCGLVQFLVWATPTEASCAHDVFLYDRHHMAISQAARALYVQAVHFRDAALVRSIGTVDLAGAALRARLEAMRALQWRGANPSAPAAGGSQWGYPDVNCTIGAWR